MTNKIPHLPLWPETTKKIQELLNHKVFYFNIFQYSLVYILFVFIKDMKYTSNFNENA